MFALLKLFVALGHDKFNDVVWMRSANDFRSVKRGDLLRRHGCPIFPLGVGKLRFRAAVITLLVGPRSLPVPPRACRADGFARRSERDSSDPGLASRRPLFFRRALTSLYFPQRVAPATSVRSRILSPANPTP